MDPFSLAVGSLTLVDTCLSLGKVLITKYEYYKNADQDVAETLLKLKVLWDKSEIQMGILKRCWDSLESSHQQNQHMLFCILENKLQKAARLLDDAIGATQYDAQFLDVFKKAGKVNRRRYVLSVKGSLEKPIAEIDHWHNLFDTSWYLLAKVTSESLDKHLNISQSPQSSPTASLVSLRKSIHDLASQSYQSIKDISSVDFLDARYPIADSSAALARFQDRNSFAIVDSMMISPLADTVTTTKDVRALSKALSRMDPSTFGLLKCCGVIRKSRPTNDKDLLGFDIVFEAPKHLSNPRSLRDLLNSPQPSLNFRLATSMQLATSVLYLYTAGFVHKNIRPETILIFDNENSSKKTAFLVGFENFRMSDSPTWFGGDTALDRNLYRHPSRQGNHPQDTYILQHDMYSLGVCLLEIGLWTPFIKQTDPDPQGGVMLVPELGFSAIVNTDNEQKRALNIKKSLLTLAEERLPICMGKRFADIVLNCLTCLDGNHPQSLPSHTDSGDVENGIRYIEDVLERIHEIVI